MDRTDANLAVFLVVAALVVHARGEAPSRELVELLALSQAEGPLGEIRPAGRPPLWDLLLWGWVRLLESGAARLLSAVLIALQVGVVFGTARLLLSRGLSVAVAVFVLLAPVSLGLAQDIRPDALLSLAVTCAWGSWLAGWADRGGARGIAHGAAVLVAVYTHPWAVLAVLPQVGLSAASLSAATMRRWGLLVVAGLPSLVWFSGLGEVHPAPDALLSVLRVLAFDEPLTLGIAALLIAAVIRRPLPHTGALVLWLLAPVLVGMLLPGGIALRYAAVCLPALWLLVGQGLAGLPGGPRLGVAALLLGLGVLSLSHRLESPYPRADWDALAEAVEPGIRGEDVLAGDSAAAWSVVLERALDAEIPLETSAVRAITQPAEGHRLWWLLGERPERYEAATRRLRDHAVILQEITAGRGVALLTCPGCRKGNLPEAVLEPPLIGAWEDDSLFLYTATAVVLPDLTAGRPGRYGVDVVARGSAAGGVPAKLEITLLGAEPEGAWVWSVPEQMTAHRVTFQAREPGAVVLRFLNDGAAEGPEGPEDRNIWIQAVALSALPDR